GPVSDRDRTRPLSPLRGDSYATHPGTHPPAPPPHPVGADDVAQAMKTALAGKTPAERTVTINLTGEG
ncbi:hypothetical protein ACFV0K_18005, partial [Streptomyces sp. NPDC059586]